MPLVADSSMLVTLSKGGLIDWLPLIGVVCLLTDVMWDSELKPLLEEHRGLKPVREPLTEHEMMQVFRLKRCNRLLSVADASAHVLALRVGRPLLTRDGPLKTCSTNAHIRCLDLEWCLDEFARKRVPPDALRAAVERVQAEETGPDISALSEWMNLFEASLRVRAVRQNDMALPRRRRTR